MASDRTFWKAPPEPDVEPSEGMDGRATEARTGVIGMDIGVYFIS
jgi:hypothetical protein